MLDILISFSFFTLRQQNIVVSLQYDSAFKFLFLQTGDAYLRR